MVFGQKTFVLCNIIVELWSEQQQCLLERFVQEQTFSVSTERFHFLLDSLRSLSRFLFLFYTEPTQRAKALSNYLLSLSTYTGRCLISWDGVTLNTALLSTGRLDYSARTSTNSARMSTGRLDYSARTSTNRECCQGYNCPLILVGFCSK